MKQTQLLFLLISILFPFQLFSQAGELDCTFGNEGVVFTEFTSGHENVAENLAAYEWGTYDGKIIVVGNAHDASDVADFGIARYNPDGSLDTDFGNSGKVTIDFGYDYESAQGVVIQPDDKIVVVGKSGNPSYAAIARLNADGSLDNTFSSDGKLRTTEGYWNEVDIDGNGNIWISGSTSNRSSILKISSDGSSQNLYEYDLTSGTTCCEGFSDIIVDANNKILAVGAAEQSSRDMSIIRINTDGTYDNTFDSDGKKYIDFSSSQWDNAGSVTINSSGQIAVGGEANDGDMGVALLNSDGSFVTSFSGDGKASVDLDGGTSDQSGMGVAFQPDGKIILGGYAGGQYGAARFNSDGSLDNTFGDNGKVIYFSGASSGDYPNDMILTPEGKFIGVGIAWTTSGDAGKDFGILSIRTQSEDMLYGSTTTAQNTNVLSPGTEGDVIRVEVDMCGDLNPYSVTQLNLSTNGSTNAADINSAKVYYTGTSNSFATTTQFGSIVNNPGGSFNITGSQELKHGTNYFWVAYTIDADANQGNVVDAECSEITIDNGIGSVVPSITAPTGNREIKYIIFEENFGAEGDPLPSEWTIQDVDGDTYNWTKINDEYGWPNGRSGGGVRSATYGDSDYTPVDNRLITKEIDLTNVSSATLSYYVSSIDNYGGYETENIEVYISTSWNGSDNFPTTTQIDNYTTSSDSWVERTVNLDAYTGETVHIAWRHNMSDATSSWALRMDDIIITGVPANTKATVSTQAVSNIVEESATGNGTIDALGTPNPTSHGFCWNTTGTPTVSDNSTDNGGVTSTGSFSSSISGLTPNKTYFVRAYATNDAGTSYGSQVSFTTNTYELTIDGSFSVGNKIYDGNTSAVITTNNLTLSGIQTGDDVALNNIASVFVTPDTGTGIEVNINNAGLTGTDADKYTLSLSGAPTTTADISQKELTITGASAENKVYDGTTGANISGATLSGVVGSEDVVLDNATSGTFAQKDVGSGIVISTSMSISGTDAGNYSLTKPSGLTADITAKELTVTGAIAENKVYDGTNGATISGATLSGVVGSEDVVLDNATNGTFAQKDIGSGIVVSTSMSINGADAGNYSLTQPSGLTADITAKELTVTGAIAENKVYDGTNGATISDATLSGVVGSEDVVLDNATSGTFAQKDVGNDIAVNHSMTISGMDTGNYTFTKPSGLTADITAKELIVTGTSVENRVYNGTTEAIISGATLSGIVGSEDVVLDNASIGTFAQKDIGSDIVVSTSMSISGADAGNYSLTQPSGLTAEITAKKLTVTGAIAESKVYDGTNGATISGATLSGVVGSEDIVLDNATSGTFAQKNVGSGIAVSPSMSIGGTEAGNYSLTQPSGLVADITAKALTVKANDKTRERCAPNPDFTISYNGFVNSEDTNVLTSQPEISCSADETSVSGTYEITVSSGSAQNYSFSYVNGTLTITDDVTNPTLSVQDITVDLDESGKASITAVDLITSASDNCSLADTTLSQYGFTTDDVGDNNIDVTVKDETGNSTTKTAIISVNTVTTGINDIKNIDVDIYPNPTNGKVNLEFNGKTPRKLNILNLTGKSIINKPDLQEKCTLNLSQLPNGIYLLRIYVGESILIKKIIKK